MITSGKKFISKILGISCRSKDNILLEEKQEKEQKEKTLRIALLSGSIRRIK